MGTSSCCCFEEPVPWVTASSCKKIYPSLENLILSHLVVSKPRVIASSEAPANLKVEVQNTNANCKYLRKVQTNHSPILPHQITVKIPHSQFPPKYFCLTYRMIQLNLILSNYHWLFITYTPLHSKEDTQGLSQRWAQHNMATANDQQLKLIVNGIKYVLPLNLPLNRRSPTFMRAISLYICLFRPCTETLWKSFFFQTWVSGKLMNYMGFDAFSYPPVLSVYCVKIPHL